jgi:hypothetical protein
VPVEIGTAALRCLTTKAQAMIAPAPVIPASADAAADATRALCLNVARLGSPNSSVREAPGKHSSPRGFVFWAVCRRHRLLPQSFFRLPLHGRCRRVLALDPVVGAAGDIARTYSLPDEPRTQCQQSRVSLVGSPERGSTFPAADQQAASKDCQREPPPTEDQQTGATDRQREPKNKFDDPC